MLQVLPSERLHDVLAASDYIVNALPLTGLTRHMVNAAAIKAMKPTAVFCNVGRGKTVDEAALVAGAAILSRSRAMSFAQLQCRPPKVVP